MRKRSGTIRWALLGMLLMSVGCGPISATSALHQAQDQQRKAKLVGVHEIKPGEKYITPAQFEYQLAYEYIEKSKELQGFSKFDAAAFYGKQAETLLRKAQENKQEEERRKERRQQIKAGKVFK